jgi:hypothetical protein
MEAIAGRMIRSAIFRQIRGRADVAPLQAAENKREKTKRLHGKGHPTLTLSP